MKDHILPHPRKLSDDTLKTLIRDMGLKVTDQRLLILKALQAGRVHVTAQEVFELVHKQDSSIGFATVYRFMRALTDSHFVTEVRVGGASARYELKPEGHHDHLTCTSCGRICEFENNKIEQLQEHVAREFGFKLTSHVLELYGLCPQCQKSKGEAK
jgi:Fur family ferric uptake transcriptional regulator